MKAQAKVDRKFLKTPFGGVKLRDEYHYMTLQEINMEICNLNLFGVIIDCSAPYYMERIGKYLLTMKLVDVTLNPKNSTKRHISLTVFAKMSDCLPPISELGSVIRFHRVQSTKYKDWYQLNCDVDIKGAWVLFGRSGATPLSESGSTHTFTTKDKKLLDEIRKFSQKFFADYTFKTVSLKDGGAVEFDVICFVAYVKKKGENFVVKFYDPTKVVKAIIKTQYAPLKPGTLVKIRGAHYEESNHKMLALMEYSSVVQLPKKCKSESDFFKQMDSANDDVKWVKAMYPLDPTATITCSKIFGDCVDTKITHLFELFSGSLGKEDHYRVRVSAATVCPKLSRDWLKIFDESSKKMYCV